MNLLAIETATLEVGAAIYGSDGPLAVSRARPGRLYTETLHPAIASVLAESGVSLSAIDAVAVDVGPGLFTGVRVGVAAAKAIGFTRRVPLVAVTSLEALTADATSTRASDDVVIVPVVDIRRGEVAWMLPDAIITIGSAAALVETVRALDRPVLLVGDGSDVARRELAGQDGQLGNIAFGGEDLFAPSVNGVAMVGRRRLIDGGVTNAIDIDAVYLRAADARANFSTRDDAPVGGAR